MLGDISIFFSRVGPGVFFSLFGAAVVAPSLQHGLELDIARKAKGVLRPDASGRGLIGTWGYTQADSGAGTWKLRRAD